MEHICILKYACTCVSVQCYTQIHTRKRALYSRQHMDYVLHKARSQYLSAWTNTVDNSGGLMLSYLVKVGDFTYTLNF